MVTPQMIADVNTLAEFLAHNDNDALSSPVDCVVLCGSAILTQAETIFNMLAQTPGLAKMLVLCGGRGHSTSYMFNAIQTHPVYHELAESVKGLSEAEMLWHMLHKYFDVERITTGCKILVEERSTNCGANAHETRRVLIDAGITDVRSCVIVQDPTMSLRTVASFRKAFAGDEVQTEFSAYPTFTPRMLCSEDDQGIAYNVPGISETLLWKKERFWELIMGEIPRLRDDKNGYGPNGKGFIVHVDLPKQVETAWERLNDSGLVESQR